MKRVTGGSLPAEIWQAFMLEAIRSDTEFETELPQIESFPAELRTQTEPIQIAADSLGAPPKTQRASRTSNTADPQYRSAWKGRWAERRKRGERPGLASRGFLQHLFR